MQQMKFIKTGVWFDQALVFSLDQRRPTRQPMNLLQLLQILKLSTQTEHRIR